MTLKELIFKHRCFVDVFIDNEWVELDDMNESSDGFYRLLIDEETFCLFGDCLDGNRLCSQRTGSDEYGANADVILGGCKNK